MIARFNPNQLEGMQTKTIRFILVKPYPIRANLIQIKVEECKSHVLIRTLSYFSKWKR